MKKVLTIALSIVLIICFTATISTAAKRTKFGVDKRHALAKKVDFKTSDQNIKWKMVMPWSKGLLFYDVAVHFCDSVRLASAGRLDIKPFSAGELVPAMASFDAVSKGSADCGHDWPGYWKGKNEAFVAIASVPFGLDGEGYGIWLYERGGAEMMDELYGQFNMVAFPCGQLDQEMGLSSNKRASKMEDFKGMRIRTVGWYMDVLNRMGASVSPLPGGEIYLALERGVIDAGEFSSPAMTYPMGFDDICKYCIAPGVHQPGIQCALFINKKKWAALPEDLKQIVKICAVETQGWSQWWIQNLNAKAIKLLGKKMEFVKMSDEAMSDFARVTKAYLEELKAKYPDVKKILDSQEKFKEDYAEWREMKSGVAPWPIDDYIAGKHMQ
ncbi:MAG: TRAP transporter substrate-binding protein DctP [Deltaproteobacteria bacterium]|nr:TRAP transporter substrate-binding protein DctP [Deltaproteobacteria bacterium]